MLATAALIVLRSLVFLQYEQADFDADQAIVGLMAKHLSEGRAWPLFFYGQLYMMGVQAWMAAPVFLLLGPTVFALKLPLLVLNVLTGALLVWLLVRDAGLRAWQAALATSWFTLVPPVTASRMVQAQGGTIEPLLYALLLWLLRRRAIAFGLLFAFGFLQREFTLFAVLAIGAIEAWTGELFSRRRVAHWLVVLLVFLGARESVTLLRHTASMFGPDAAPPRLDDGVTNVDLVARSVCLAPGHVLGNLEWLVSHNVPTFFGAQRQPAGILVLSGNATGQPWAAVPALVAMLAAGVIVVRRGWRVLPPLRRPDDPRVLLPVMLLITGGLGLAGVATGCDVRSLITIRYHLLLALAPVGLTALAFVAAGSSTGIAEGATLRERALPAAVADGSLVGPAVPAWPVAGPAVPDGVARSAVADDSAVGPAVPAWPVAGPAVPDGVARSAVADGSLVGPAVPAWPVATRTMVAGIVVWAAAMAWQHSRLLHEYRTAPPPSVYRILADDLVEHGDRYGWASYWVSYHVDFLSREQLQLSPTSSIRISDYARQAWRAGPRAVVIGNDPCDAGDLARKVEGWWICRKSE